MASDPDSTTSDERATAVSTFQTFTGVESSSVAERELAATNWNLHQAIDHYMEHGPRAQTTEVAQAPQNSQPTTANRETRIVERPRQTRGLWSWLARIAWAPLGFVAQIASRVWRFINTLVGGEYQSIPGGWRGFRNYYNERYGANHVPFFEGTYWDAMAECQKEVKFLVVYLHAEAQDLTRQFCENVLRDTTLAHRLTEGRTIFWAGSYGSREGSAVRRALRLYTYPCIAIVEASKMKVEAREKGSHGLNVALARRPLHSIGYGKVLSYRSGLELVRGGPSETIRWLDRTQQRHCSKLDAILAERQERENQRLLREEQDAAFRASLEADQAAAEKEKQEKEEERAKLQQQERRESRRRDKEARLGEEPEKSVEVCVLRLRKPDGTSVSRRFKRQDLLDKVFDWVEVTGLDMETSVLVCNFPRKHWRYPEDSETTLENAGFFPSATLMVEERDEEHEESSV